VGESFEHDKSKRNQGKRSNHSTLDDEIHENDVQMKKLKLPEEDS
jgi:hypothetical protein